MTNHDRELRELKRLLDGARCQVLVLQAGINAVFATAPNREQLRTAFSTASDIALGQLQANRRDLDPEAIRLAESVQKRMAAALEKTRH